ncbi:MAG TPA: hypothetical protein PLD10_07160, partial [Rhodopila sp.]|nr:hypothetical protein [Rhodopila sp.]
DRQFGFTMPSAMVSGDFTYIRSLDAGSASYTGDGTSAVAVWGMMCGSPGSYIPTTTAPVTVTDYTISGTTVNLAQAPASQALCTWDGVGF